MKLDMRKKQEKKETTKSTKKLPMTAKMKRAIAVYIAMVLIMTAGASTVFAADDPLTVINNLSTFIFGLIRAIGMILLGFGIVQVGLSLKSHDPSQRANGFLTLAGGVIITFAKEILNLITALKHPSRKRHSHFCQSTYPILLSSLPCSDLHIGKQSC